MVAAAELGPSVCNWFAVEVFIAAVLTLKATGYVPNEARCLHIAR